MTPNERPKPRFEPPPWETEAFNRFHREQESLRVAEELEQELITVRDPSSDATESAPLPRLAPEEEPAVVPAAAVEAVTPVPDSRIEAMLAELRVEETPATKAGLTLVYSAVAFMGTTGFFIAIAGLMLFAKTRSTDGSATMLAAMTALVMLLAGGGCIAGAVMLYRKHHQ
ncbi:MAG: hypothetical protein ACYC2X_10165 [Coriobacteriia bacterium]